MQKFHAKIKVYSDVEDVSSIHSSLRQLELKSLPVIVQNTRRFSVLPNDIIILQLNDLESPLLNKLVKIKNNIKNKVIFVIPENNALLVSSIAKLGFIDIFILPFEIYKLISYLEEIIINNAFLTTVLPTEKFAENIDSFDAIIGSSEKLKKVIDFAKKAAEKKDLNILIRGETGTGKGMLAKAIHNINKDKKGSFVDIVCSSIPENLLESELFGYEPGAFTSAKNRKLGLFELAEEGTLFLDEIGDLSTDIQKKLLRAIDKKLIRRLGGLHDIPINTRIISATNMDLESLIVEYKFRSDLYHRLNVIMLELPPLRERGDDVLQLADHFIKEFNKQFNKSIKRMDAEARNFILKYPWLGNIREIRNTFERAVLLSSQPVLRLNDLSNIVNMAPARANTESGEHLVFPQHIKLNLNYTSTSLDKLNQEYIQALLNKTGNNKSKAAKFLGISRARLDRMIK